eukprot:8093721-Pyramimonas_sp.AAC.1
MQEGILASLLANWKAWKGCGRTTPPGCFEGTRRMRGFHNSTDAGSSYSVSLLHLLHPVTDQTQWSCSPARTYPGCWTSSAAGVKKNPDSH